MQGLDRMDLALAVRRLPKKVRELLKKHGPKLFLAGGYLRSVITSERVSDIDLFCHSKEYAAALAKEISPKDGPPPYQTDNAITVKLKPFAVQFVHRWTFDNAVQALDSFDFTIAQAAIWWDPVGPNQEVQRWSSICSHRFYSDLAAKRLMYTAPDRQEAPGGSMLRVLKFYQRGYRIPLDSLGAVIARLGMGVLHDEVTILGEDGPSSGWADESRATKVITGLLREVDPDIDADHISHLPAGADLAEDLQEEKADASS